MKELKRLFLIIILIFPAVKVQTPTLTEYKFELITTSSDIITSISVQRDL